jgi:hypothetical protein
MNRTLLTSAVCTLAGALIASAQVPSLINYQGRLTDANGAPVTGSKTFAISVYDAATAGNLLYSESIGAVTLDSNGVYSFQFGNSGTSNTQVTETIGTTAGSTLSYTKTLSSTPVVANSITVTDGTNSWSQSAGNPGTGATATANTISGFVIGATITNGGSGYTSAPTVTITGSGSGAAATATISGGVVTGITITSAGSGYTGGATITIAPPVIPFRVDYSGGAITATYSSAPTAGRTISATYRYGTNGIIAALSSGAEHWISISVDGALQGTRQRVLAAPFATKAQFAEKSSGELQREIEDMKNDLSLIAGGISTSSIVSESFSTSKSKVNLTDTALVDVGPSYSPIQTVSGTSSGNYTGTVDLSFNSSYMRGLTVTYDGIVVGYSGNIFYVDGSSAAISGSSTGGHLANPNPNKQVNRVNITMGANYGRNSTLTVTLNKSGNLGINLPATIPSKPKIGFYPNIQSAIESDSVSAKLIGDTGGQSIAVNGYTSISQSIGRPQKIVMTYSPGNSNSALCPKVTGYLLRFSN